MRTIIFFICLAISLSYFLWEILRRCLYIRLGRAEVRNESPAARWKFFFNHVIFNEKIREYPMVAIFHSFILWGFIVLSLSSLDMALLFLFQTSLPVIGDSLVYAFLRDTCILLVMIGAIGFGLRRKFFRPGWLHNSYKAYAILILIFIIVLSELFFFMTVSVLGEGEMPNTAWFTAMLANLLISMNIDYIRTIGEVSAWIHFMAIFSFFFIIPNSKHLHLIFAPFNIFWHKQETRGALVPVTLDLKQPQRCGVRTIEDFSRKQLLDTFSCVLCGRCHGQCPSERSKEWLKPKRLNGLIRTYLEEEGSQLLKKKKVQTGYSRSAITEKDLVGSNVSKKVVGEIFHLDFIWSCTTCGGCNDACPVSIDHLSKLIEMRRNIVSEDNHLPSELKEVFIGVESCGNPYGQDRQASELNTYLHNLGVPTIKEKPAAEYLLYLGCQASLDETAQKAAIAFAQILKYAGIDFAVLGHEEWCCGETVRRMGNELLFQKTVQKNISAWSELGIKKIITICPHCFNTFKNEYPQFGGSYEVIPHSIFLLNLLQQGKIKPWQNLAKQHKDQLSSKGNITLTYHDPCYLGRCNGIFAEPREVLGSIPGAEFVELSRARELSFCCGAGGGRFWTRKSSPNPISKNRAKEALAAKADIVVTACPYCRTVLQEEIEHDPARNVLVLDIAELIDISV